MISSIPKFPAGRTQPELRFLVTLLWPYSTGLTVAMVLLLADSWITLALPWFAGRVVESLLASVVPGRLLLVWLIIMGVQGLIFFGTNLLLGTTSSRIVAGLGNRVYDHLQSLPLSWHQERKRGETLALLTNDVWRISGFLTGTVTPLLPLLLTCVGAFVLLLSIEPLIGLGVAISVPVLILALKLLTRHLRPLADASLREDAIKYGIAEQNLAALPLIKAFAREAEESRRYATQGDTVCSLEVKQIRIGAALTPLVRWVGAASVIGLLWLGSRGIVAGRITPSELVSLLLYGLLLTQPVSQLAGVYGQLQSARGSAWRLMNLFDQSPEPDSGRIEVGTVKGEIAFERVGFAYPGREATLVDFDLHIAAGETVAITGPNGAGKSTVAHLITRFIDPTSGRVLLDGVDLRELSLTGLREKVGLVSQNVLLFNASVSHNIGYGRYAATREQIEAAARAANAHAFISSLPCGYDTIIGDEGVLLSGGQRQRIALARALIKDPPILILDEATAMFDPEGERGFIADCHDTLHARTVLIITHRPASLALADRVLRLEHGRMQNVAIASGRRGAPGTQPEG